VSSFGYSGTIVHALLQDDGDGGQAPVDSVPVRFNRRRFPWPRPAIVAAADEAELLSFGFSWVDSDVPEAGGNGGLDWLLIGERKQVGPASRVYHEQPSKVTALSEVGGKSVRNVVLLAETHDAAAPSMLGMSTLLAVTRQLIQMKPPPRLLCLCRGTQHPRPLELAEPMAAASAGGVWGFLRSVALEQPAADWLIRDVRSEPSATEVARMLRAAAAFGEDGGVPRELAQSSSGTWHAPRLVRTGAIPSSADSVSGAGVNIITGGLGGLGLRAAKALAGDPSSHLVLSSRSGRITRAGQGLGAQLRSLEASKSNLRIRACDIAAPEDAVALLRESHSLRRPRLATRVIHAAGVLADGLVRKLTPNDLGAVFAAKAHGAAAIHSASTTLNFSAFVAFSSVASAYGNIGQANYAGANSYLDVLVTLRRACGLRGCSLQLPPVGGAGMGEALASKFSGMAEIWTLPLERYAAWLAQSLSLCPSAVATALSSDALAQFPVSARALLVDDALGRGAASAMPPPSGPARAADLSTEQIQSTLLREVTALTSIDALTVDTPLMEAGVDSMAALELRNRVEEVMGVRLKNEDLLADADELTVAQLTSAIERRAAAAGGGAAGESGPSSGGSVSLSFMNTSVVAGTAAPIAERLRRPILFVLSSPRSGSSLLQLCLQANPALYAGQELYLLMFDSMGERAAVPEMRFVEEGLVKTIMELSASSAAAARARIARFGADCPTWRVYQALQRMSGPRMLVDKTPANASHVSFMRRARETFEHARYIHLIRHPYACISSGLQMFRDFLDVSETTWAMVEQSWVDTNRACDEFMAELRAEQPEQRGQSMVLRYEDFLRDPAGATRGVCEALLGVEWAEGMANPYETSAIQSFEAAESKSTTDQKLLKRKAIEPRQAEKWREVQLPQPLLETTKALAAGHGYELLPDLTPELSWIAQPEGTPAGAPTVCIHDFTGLLWGFRTLAPLLSASGCLGIRASTRLLDGCAYMQELAAQYVQLLPKGLWKGGAPVRLVGYSLGCRVAYWMACLLEAEGRPVELVLLDGPVRGDAGYPGRMGGFASQVADDIRANMNLPAREDGAAQATDSGSEPSAAAKMQFSVMKRSGSFRMFSLLEDAGEDAAAAAVRLIELPDVDDGSLREFEGPVLFAHTEQIRENGTADVVLQRVAHATVHKVPGDHFSFITKHAVQVAELLAGWPASQVPEIPTPAFEISPTPVRGSEGGARL